MELNDSFHNCFNNGDYKKAAAIGEKVIIAAKKELGENDPEYAGSLNNLALVYRILGQYKKAEPLFIRSMNITKKIFGEDDPEYARCLINFADLYTETGQFAKAETFFIRGNEIRKKELGENDPAYAESLNNFGLLYIEMGEYAKAELLYIQAMDIRKRILGEDDPQYAGSLANLSDLYQIMGQTEKAERLALQAIEIRKKTLGEDDPDYASSLNNLASLYNITGRYEKAEPLFIQALNIWKKTLGEEYPDYANCLSNLAILYCDLGQYAKAEPLLIQSMEIIKMSMGKDNPAYVMCLQNLGALYVRMNQYAKAEPLYLQAKEIYKASWGENNPDYAMILDNLAGLYNNMGQYAKAEPFYLMNSKIVFENIKKDFTILSGKEKGHYLNNNVSILETNNSFIYKYRSVSSSLVKNNFNQQLFFKYLTLADTRNMLASIQQNPDTAVQRLFTNWQAAKRFLAKQYALPAADRAADMKKIEIQTEDLEKELTRKSAPFRRQQMAMSTSLTDVQKGLQKDEAAIEFVSFNLYNNELSDTVIYAAYILNKYDSLPVFVSLCEENQLQQLFDKAGKNTASMVSSLYRGGEVRNTSGVSPGISLYKLVWRPLEPYLKGVKKISYSPAGKLNSIAFHALPINDTTVLMDKYQLQQYTSTRQVVLHSAENQTTKPGNIILFGNAMFTMDSLQLTKQNQNGKENSSIVIYTPQKRGGDDKAWKDLPGTAEEVKTVKQLFDENKINAKSFVQSEASEENLKALNGHSPQILHIATHGFFLPEPDKKKRVKGFNQGNTYALADDPLLRSGILLAGCNYAWSGKTPVEGVEDGIATAYEISQMNLSNTELVVLSACETALGDVKGSEGVFGLQRAFKMAGVKKMIVSLWQVPDKETAELMTSFYSYWMKGKSISQSFTQAQADMRKKYAPFYWAAFVLVE